MLYQFNNTPAVVGINNNSFIPLSPSEATSSTTILRIIEENPNTIRAGFCYSPLLCIGKNIQFDDGPVANLILMSPCGFVVVVSTKPLAKCSPADITKDSEAMDSELKHVSFDTLDDICIEYTHHRFSKVNDIIGLMSEAGYLCSEEETTLSRAVNKNLRNSRFLYVAVVRDVPDFSMDERFDMGFLCVNTYGSDSNSFAVLSLKLLEGG